MVMESSRAPKSLTITMHMQTMRRLVTLALTGLFLQVFDEQHCSFDPTNSQQPYQYHTINANGYACCNAPFLLRTLRRLH